jgi:DNA-directed RNA polymerase specialized sigma24 family protein
MTSLRRGSLPHVTEATRQNGRVATLLQRAVDRALVMDLLRKVDVETRAILELRAEKFRIEEIAEFLDTTPSAIKSKTSPPKRRMKEGGAA